MRHVLHKVNQRPAHYNLCRATVVNYNSMEETSKRTQLQTLWDLAESTLGPCRQPTKPQLEALKHAMALIPLHELGLDPQNNHIPKNDNQITYLHIYEDKNFSLGVFCLPAAAVIPLHNHPGMTVFSRVLSGSMHVKSYDWIDPFNPSLGARIVQDRIINSSEVPTTLFPNSGGNIHQFTAVTDCAVLDLLSPPYSSDEGRDCTYYKSVEGPHGIVLQEFEPPDNFPIISGLYQGVRVEKIQAKKQTKVGQVQMTAGADAGGWSFSSHGSGGVEDERYSPRSVNPLADYASALDSSVVCEENKGTTELISEFEKSHLGGHVVNDTSSERTR